MNLSNTIDLATCRGPMQPPYPSPLRWALTSAFGTAPGLRGPPGAREWRAAYRNENRPPEWTRIAREQGQNGSPRGKQLPAMSPGAVGGRWPAWNGNSPELPISVAGLISRCAESTIVLSSAPSPACGFPDFTVLASSLSAEIRECIYI